jgi:hypothetical protein
VSDEKRRYRRYSVNCQFTGSALRPVGAAVGGVPRPAIDISGEIPNVSAGGICLLTDDKIDVADAVRCEIAVPTFPIGIPSLLNVRWACPGDGRYTYRLGLEFLA